MSVLSVLKGKAALVTNMGKGQRHWSPTTRAKARYIAFDLVGVAGLVLEGHYSGPYREAVHSYGGNIAASFAVYYVVAFVPFPPRFRKALTAGLALAVVELFEALNGFGVMTNVYDSVDFAANAGGIALALAVDSLTSGISRPPAHHGGQTASGMRGLPAG